MKPRIYRYIVRHDGGSAPRPYGGVCTLAICKPMIRRTADINDWVIGLRSRSPCQVIYVMQVAESIALGEYWLKADYTNRRPGFSPIPDNIYKLSENGELEQVNNGVHDLDLMGRDVSGQYALVGTRFWYFGSNSPPLPTCLEHLAHRGVGYSVYKNRRADDTEKLEKWLATWPCGVHGRPIDATTETLDWLVTAAGHAQPSAKHQAEEHANAIVTAYRTGSSTGRCSR